MLETGIELMSNQIKRTEPEPEAWEATILPLNYHRRCIIKM
jgi:hypothetical protein